MFNWILYGITIICSIVCIFIISQVKKHSYWKLKGVPYLKPRIVLGNLQDVFWGRTSVSKKLQEIYRATDDPFIGFYAMDSTPILMIKNPVLIKKVLIEDFRYFPNRSFVDNSYHDPVGERTLFMAKNSQWVTQRKRLAPIFSNAKLYSKSGVLIQSAEKLCCCLRNILKTEKIFNIREEISKYAIDSITSTFLGLEVCCMDNKNDAFLDVAEGILTGESKWKPFKFLLMHLGQFAHKLTPIRILDPNEEAFFLKMTKELMENREKTQIKNNDLIDILVDIKNKEIMCTREQENSLAALLLQTFIGGYESSTGTVSFALYELARNPEVQDTLREEVRDVLEKYGRFTYESIKSMKYMFMVLSEVLRLHPILPMVDRKCQMDYKIPETEIVLDKGTIIYVPLEAIQHDAKNFPNPEMFDPLRFLNVKPKTEMELIHFPFGLGPRSCPGYRMANFSVATALAHVVLNFELKICKRSHKAAEQHPRSILRLPVEGIFLELIDLNTK